MRSVFVGFFVFMAAMMAAFVMPVRAEDLRNRDYSAVDRWVAATPPEAETSIENLAAYLGRGASGEAEKVRAVFRWILLGPDHFKVSQALGIQATTCGGAADIFCRLCERLRVQAVEIIGYYRTLSKDCKPSMELHGWNAAYVGGAWHLFDTMIRGSQKDETYFDLSPGEMIYNHIPLDPKWQLLERPLSDKEVETLPFTGGVFGRENYRISYSQGNGEGMIEVVFPAGRPPVLDFFSGGYNFRPKGFRLVFYREPILRAIFPLPEGKWGFSVRGVGPQGVSYYARTVEP